MGEKVREFSQVDYESEASDQSIRINTSSLMDNGEDSEFKEGAIKNKRKCSSGNISYFDMRKSKRLHRPRITRSPPLKHCRVVRQEEVQRKPKYRYENKWNNWIYCWFLGNILHRVSYQIWHSLKLLEQEKKWDLFDELVRQLDFLKLVAIRQYLENPEVINMGVLSEEIPESHDELSKFFVDSLGNEGPRKWSQLSLNLASAMSSKHFRISASKLLKRKSKRNFEYFSSEDKGGKVSPNISLSRLEKLQLLSKIMGLEIDILLEWTIIALEQLYIINQKSLFEDKKRHIEMDQRMKLPPVSHKTFFSLRSSFCTQPVSPIEVVTLLENSEGWTGFDSVGQIGKIVSLQCVDFKNQQLSEGHSCHVEEGKITYFTSGNKEEIVEVLMDPNLNKKMYEPVLQQLANEEFIAFRSIRKKVLIDLIENGIAEHIPGNRSSLVSGSNDICSTINFDSSAVYNFMTLPSSLKYERMYPTEDTKKLLLEHWAETEFEKEIVIPEKNRVIRSKKLVILNKILENKHYNFSDPNYATITKRAPKSLNSKRSLWYCKWLDELSRSTVHFIENLPSNTNPEEKIQWKELEFELMALFKAFKSTLVPYSQEVFGTLTLPPRSLKTRYILFKRDCPLKYGKNPRLWDYGKAIRFLKDMCLETGALQKKFASLQQGNFSTLAEMTALKTPDLINPKEKNRSPEAITNSSPSVESTRKESTFKMITSSTKTLPISDPITKEREIQSPIQQELSGYNKENIIKERNIMSPGSVSSLMKDVIMSPRNSPSDVQTAQKKVAQGNFSQKPVITLSNRETLENKFELEEVENPEGSQNSPFGQVWHPPNSENNSFLFTVQSRTVPENKKSPSSFLFTESNCLNKPGLLPLPNSVQNFHIKDLHTMTSSNTSTQELNHLKKFVLPCRDLKSGEGESITTASKGEESLKPSKKSRIDSGEKTPSKNIQDFEHGPKIFASSDNTFSNTQISQNGINNNPLDALQLFAQHKMKASADRFSDAQLKVVKKMLFSVTNFSCSKIIEESEKWFKKIEERDKILNYLSEEVMKGETMRATLVGKLEKKVKTVEDLQKSVQLLQNISLQKDLKLCEYQSKFGEL